ncbi:MAG TPA: host attachment protein [Sphingomonadaceae bacterium]
MLLPHGTVVALADGERLELYRNMGRGLAPELERIENPTLDEHNKGAGTHHHSNTGNPQPHLLEEDEHAAAVAEWLNGEVVDHRIEHLVVIAAPRTLGELRKHYHRLTGEALVGELDKDLVGQPHERIVEALLEKT